MTDPPPPVRRVLPLLLGVLLAAGAAGAWWLDVARPVPPVEIVRADAWLRTEAMLAAPSPDAVPAAGWEDVREDLARQLEALGPAPEDRASEAARAQRPSPADAGAPRPPASAALRESAAGLADDALAAEDPALARVLAATAVSRAAAARQLEEPGLPDGPGLCDPGGDPGTGGTAAHGAVLWSALDRAGYAYEALAARAREAPPGSASAELLARGLADVEDLLAVPAARQVLAAEPGLPAGAYVLPEDATEHPGRAADTAARDVQEAAAHVLARGDAGTRCWALVALERATGLRAALTGDVDALPGVLPGDRPG